jgi:hypothetical protein
VVTRHRRGELVFYESDDRFGAEVDGEPVEVLVEKRVGVEDIVIDVKPRGETVKVAHSGVVSDEVVGPAESLPVAVDVDVRYEPGHRMGPPELATGEVLDLLAESHGLRRVRDSGDDDEPLETDEHLRARLLALLGGPHTAPAPGGDARDVALPAGALPRLPGRKGDE